jgi:murein DD-endopeptidase MepM/ murein hydrolase activator NlpD
MFNAKYKYNPKTLSYEEVSISLWAKILKMLLYISPSIVIGIGLALVFSKQLDSPKEKAFKNEIQVYQAEFERLNKDLDLINRVLIDVQKRDEDLYRVVLYAERAPDEINYSSILSNGQYRHLDGYSNAELLKSTSEKLDMLERRLQHESNSFKELIGIAKNKEKMLTSIPSIQPVSNKLMKRMASGFGYRIDPIYKTRRKHTGMDFVANSGTDVYATGDGVIETIEVNRWGYGKSIIVNHGFGFKTRYAHLSAFKVKKGQKVKRGELIGLVGSTGKSIGPHLHYEVVQNGEKVNPINFYHSDLSPAQYEKLIEMSDKSYKAYD